MQMAEKGGLLARCLQMGGWSREHLGSQPLFRGLGGPVQELVATAEEGEGHVARLRILNRTERLFKFLAQDQLAVHTDELVSALDVRSRSGSATIGQERIDDDASTAALVLEELDAHGLCELNLPVVRGVLWVDEGLDHLWGGEILVYPEPAVDGRNAIRISRRSGLGKGILNTVEQAGTHVAGSNTQGSARHARRGGVERRRGGREER
eukprot:CAMPEP_0206044966 /NCGR_PEP_ID=MMETSP1466-20131121/14530_1 /ASSEMBLY_ACC=CAM_ASM_001126 /TAXON_ID=44452 /ORGANISM="Pavlova gyrans, Strain CCMP608" /LENGTH=208 /DNA_ID=CAMNT_0053419883 /DNA_START=78 /DNA_END=700 /DNA_ORIENTATION=+